MTFEQFFKKRYTAMSLCILLFIGVFAYGGYYLQRYLNEMRQIHQAIVAHVTAVSSIVDGLELSLSNTKGERNFLLEALTAEQGKNTLFAEQISGIAGTVGSLQKLSETDEELLQKYSKVYFLNENYIPSQLLTINAQYLSNKEKEIQIHAQVLPKLIAMMHAVALAGSPVEIISAYRSFGDQSILKKSYTFTYGSGANAFSSDQGYSEHQLGTTVDFTTTALGSDFETFDTTDAYAWLINNAHTYGFTLSYPGENAYYIFEPWHWRYVGVGLATKLYHDGIHFYAMPQRDIDKYLITIFD